MTTEIYLLVLQSQKFSRMSLSAELFAECTYHIPIKLYRAELFFTIVKNVKKTYTILDVFCFLFFYNKFTYLGTVKVGWQCRVWCCRDVQKGLVVDVGILEVWWSEDHRRYEF